MPKLSHWQQVFFQFIFFFVALFVLLPLWQTIYLAFEGGIHGRPIELVWWPKEFTFEIFAQMWRHAGQNLSFLDALTNSLIVSFGAAFFSILLGASMAYAFARFRFPGRKAGLFAMLLGAMLPPVALMTPFYIFVSALGLKASLLGLMIVYTAFAMPFCIWNMRAAFQAVPKELEEAAFLDGANRFVTFWRVSLPLALPAIGIAAIVAFLIGYSEFAMGWLFVEKPDNVTLAMAISGIIDSSANSWNRLAAMALLMSLPVVVLFVLFQKPIFERMLFGNIEE
jgi:arabinogalactan oligomer/maltooligosaccharide transport system permease protein